MCKILWWYTFSSLSVDNLRAFVQQYLDGELEIYVKSEPIPEDNSGPVKVYRYYTHTINLEDFCCKNIFIIDDSYENLSYENACALFNVNLVPRIVPTKKFSTQKYVVRNFHNLQIYGIFLSVFYCLVPKYWRGAFFDAWNKPFL